MRFASGAGWSCGSKHPSSGCRANATNLAKVSPISPKQGLWRFGAHQGEVIRLSSEIISPTCPAPHDSLSAAAPRCW